MDACSAATDGGAVAAVALGNAERTGASVKLILLLACRGEPEIAAKVDSDGRTGEGREREQEGCPLPSASVSLFLPLLTLQSISKERASVVRAGGRWQADGHGGRHDILGKPSLPLSTPQQAATTTVAGRARSSDPGTAIIRCNTHRRGTARK